MSAQHRPLIVFMAMLLGVWGLSAFDLGCPHGCSNGRRVLSQSAETTIEPRDALYRNSAVQLKVKIVPDAADHTSASDNFDINNPQPGPSPSPDSYGYPPHASWDLKGANVHTDYAPVHPSPTPDYHDYPPPAVSFHSDYAPAHANPTPEYHDYPPPAVSIHSDYAPAHANPSPDNHDYPPPASMNF